MKAKEANEGRRALPLPQLVARPSAGGVVPGGNIPGTSEEVQDDQTIASEYPLTLKETWRLDTVQVNSGESSGPVKSRPPRLI
jgi:hypothetical protein